MDPSNEGNLEFLSFLIDRGRLTRSEILISDRLTGFYFCSVMLLNFSVRSALGDPCFSGAASLIDPSESRGTTGCPLFTDLASLGTFSYFGCSAGLRLNKTLSPRQHRQLLGCVLCCSKIICCSFATSASFIDFFFLGDFICLN